MLVKDGLPTLAVISQARVCTYHNLEVSRIKWERPTEQGIFYYCLLVKLHNLCVRMLWFVYGRKNGIRMQQQTGPPF